VPSDRIGQYLSDLSSLRLVVAVGAPDVREEIILTAGASHDWNLNLGSHSWEPSALPLSDPAISKIETILSYYLIITHPSGLTGQDTDPLAVFLLKQILAQFVEQSVRTYHRHLTD